MENGWIKLHRKLLNNPVAKRAEWAWLWVTLLLLASHDERPSYIFMGKKVPLEPGQFITGRKKLSLQTGIAESTIEDILRYLESEQQIRQQKTSKFRVITIQNWASYQSLDNKPTTNRQQTDNQPTQSRIKRSKEVKNTEGATPSVAQGVVEIIDAFEAINPTFASWYKNTTERKACEQLIGTHGKEVVLKVIKEVLPVSNTQPYLPTITSPYQLMHRWASLAAGVRKEQQKTSGGVEKVIF